MSAIYLLKITSIHLWVIHFMKYYNIKNIHTILYIKHATKVERKKQLMMNYYESMV